MGGTKQSRHRLTHKQQHVCLHMVVPEALPRLTGSTGVLRAEALLPLKTRCWLRSCILLVHSQSRPTIGKKLRNVRCRCMCLQAGPADTVAGSGFGNHHQLCGTQYDLAWTCNARPSVGQKLVKPHVHIAAARRFRSCVQQSPAGHGNKLTVCMHCVPEQRWQTKTMLGSMHTGERRAGRRAHPHIA